jgi:hypothetical protein
MRPLDKKGNFSYNVLLNEAESGVLPIPTSASLSLSLFTAAQQITRWTWRQLSAKHPRRAVSSAFLLGVPSLLADVLLGLCPFSQGAGLLFSFLLAMYLGIASVISVALCSGDELRLWPSLFRAFPAIYTGLFVGFWNGLLRWLPRSRGKRVR